MSQQQLRAEEEPPQAAPPMQLEDYLSIVRVLAVTGWILLALALGLEVWMRLSKVLIWPAIGGFSRTYNAIAFEYGLTNALVSWLVWSPGWRERTPRKALARMRLLLAAVLVRDGIHLLAFVHAAGIGQGPTLTILPFLAMASFLLLPRKEAIVYLMFVSAGWLAVIGMEHAGWILSPGLLAKAFNLQGVRVAPGLALILIVLGASLLFGNFSRSRLNEGRALLFRPSIVDSLTGLFTHEFFFHRLDHNAGRAHRQGQPLSLLLIHADGFGEINDRFGHEVGDQLLQRLGGLLSGAVRSELDTPARFASTTFAILLPSAPPEGAQVVANRLLARSKELEITARGDERVSLSVGLVTYMAQELIEPALLIDLADQCLYRARGEGGGRIEAAQIGAAKDRGASN